MLQSQPLCLLFLTWRPHCGMRCHLNRDGWVINTLAHLALCLTHRAFIPNDMKPLSSWWYSMYGRVMSLCCWLPGNKQSVKKGLLKLRALSRANHLVGYCCNNARHVSDRLKLIHVVISESVAHPPPHLLCGMVTSITAKITLLHFRWKHLNCYNVWKYKCNS